MDTFPMQKRKRKKRTKKDSILEKLFLFHSCFYLQKNLLEDYLNTNIILGKSQLFIFTIFFTKWDKN